MPVNSSHDDKLYYIYWYVSFVCRSLQVSVDIKEKDGKVIKYAYKANKLPGDIDTNCKTEVSISNVWSGITSVHLM